jgi:hypothetical protein
LTEKGALAVAEALQVNSSLQELEIVSNTKISDDIHLNEYIMYQLEK